MAVRTEADISASQCIAGHSRAINTGVCGDVPSLWTEWGVLELERESVQECVHTETVH